MEDLFLSWEEVYMTRDHNDEKEEEQEGLKQVRNKADGPQLLGGRLDDQDRRRSCSFGRLH